MIKESGFLKTSKPALIADNGQPANRQKFTEIIIIRPKSSKIHMKIKDSWRYPEQ